MEEEIVTKKKKKKENNRFLKFREITLKKKVQQC